MDGLRVTISKNIQKGKTSPWGILLLIVLIPLFLALLPLLLLVFVLIQIFRFLPPRNTPEPVGSWRSVFLSPNLEIKCKWAEEGEFPDVLSEYADIDSILIFKTEPEIDFFTGYFTDFKVERIDGVFVQKIELDGTGQNIEAAPLYFFQYITGNIEKIVDLKGYDIDSRGNPEDFVIEASNDEGDVLNIHLTR